MFAGDIEARLYPPDDHMAERHGDRFDRQAFQQPFDESAMETRAYAPRVSRARPHSPSRPAVRPTNEPGDAQRMVWRMSNQGAILCRENEIMDSEST
ncbi:MAG: hypothetical protein R3C02_09205 [Planctomycetaceae bacterium]